MFILRRTNIERHALDSELTASKSSRNELLNSLSWRLTAPLRYIAGFFMEYKGSK
jgi:hypothetical protein